MNDTPPDDPPFTVPMGQYLTVTIGLPKDKVDEILTDADKLYEEWMEDGETLDD